MLHPCRLFLMVVALLLLWQLGLRSEKEKQAPPPAKQVTQAEIEQLIAQLGNDDFEKREAADQGLGINRKVGTQAA